MTIYVALLRAVNVGGTGKLPMPKLKAICGDAGFADVKTYIASGNVVFSSNFSESKVKSALETRLRDHAGKPVGVMVRNAAEIRAILKANPFKKMPPKFTAAILLDDKPPSDVADHARGLRDEKIKLGKREIYVHYPGGMGRSKLKIPAAQSGTARNMNTIAALAAMVSELKTAAKKA